MGGTKARRLVPEGFEFGHLEVSPSGVTIHVGVAREGAPAECPCCDHRCYRAHSRYARTVADLPWHGLAVRMRVRSRRMFCENGACERKIFCERLPEIAAHDRMQNKTQKPPSYASAPYWSRVARSG